MQSVAHFARRGVVPDEFRHLVTEEKHREMIGHLSDPSPRVRRAAAKVLSYFGDERKTSAALIEACRQEKDASVRSEMLESLGRTAATREAVGFLLEQGAVDALGSLLAATGQERAEARRAALAALIAEMNDDPDAGNRRHAASLLYRARTNPERDGAIHALGSYLQKEMSAEALAAAVVSLSWLTEKGTPAERANAVRALRPLLDRKETRLRVTVAKALAHMGDSAGLEVASAVLRDPKEEALFRLTAVGILGRIGNARAVTVLREMLGKTEGDLKREITRVLQTTGDDTTDGQAENPTEKIVREICAIRSGAISVRDGLAHRRRLTDEEQKRLIAHLQHNSPRVRQVAAEVLIEFGDEMRTLGPVRRAYRSEKPLSSVRSTIEEALGNHATTAEAVDFLAETKAVSALGACASDPREERAPAKQRAVDVLIRMSREAPRDRDRARAIESLCGTQGGLARQRAAEAVEQFLQRESTPDALLAGVRGLARLRGKEAVPVVKTFLRHPDINVRIAAAETLAHLGDPSAFDAATQILRDSNNSIRSREAAVMIFQILEDPRAIPILQGILKGLNREDEPLRSTIQFTLEMSERWRRPSTPQ